VRVRELAHRGRGVVGMDAGKLTSMPSWMLALGGLVNREAREFREMNYQFRRPFVLDWAATAEVFGSDYTPLDESLRQNLASFR
jgi:hypothetical protein